MSAANYGGFKGWVWKKVSGFDYDKYWKMREYIVSSRGGLLAWYYLYKIKKIDAKHLSSLGTHIGFGSAQFSEKTLFATWVEWNNCE